jgi:hypothetical protein
MSTLRRLILLGIITQLLGCSNNNSHLLSTAKNSQAAEETAEAGNFLFDMHQQGKLPGDSKDMHGEITSEMVPWSEVQSNQEVYPLSRTFHVAINGESFTNNYTVVKLSENSSWQLQRAWRIGSDGHIVQEWPTK